MVAMTAYINLILIMSGLKVQGEGGTGAVEGSVDGAMEWWL